MLKQDYSEYSNTSLEEIEVSISNSDDTNLSNIDSNKYSFYLKNSTGIIFDLFKIGFNFNKDLLKNKLLLFSPQMISIIHNSNYETCLEHIGGFGIMSELVKEISPVTKVTYSNIDSDLLKFVSWRQKKYNQDINILKLDDDFFINEMYDLIISDGVLQYFNSEKQVDIIKNMINNLNKDGTICLLVDLAGESASVLYNNVNIVDIHSILEYSDMVCIYGKNTFSSIWKKMI